MGFGGGPRREMKTLNAIGCHSIRTAKRPCNASGQGLRVAYCDQRT